MTWGNQWWLYDSWRLRILSAELTLGQMVFGYSIAFKISLAKCGIGLYANPICGVVTLGFFEIVLGWYPLGKRFWKPRRDSSE